MFSRIGLRSSAFHKPLFIRSLTIMHHPLFDQSVESFNIPGAKVFDRFFECPLGKLSSDA
jgi:hypothetical protein